MAAGRPTPETNAAAIVPLWARFRRGHIVTCPACDEGRLVLSVFDEEPAALYRLSCSRCAWESTLFFANADDVRVLANAATMPPRARRGLRF
jgi:uncharacterized protein (DUF983 family)